MFNKYYIKNSDNEYWSWRPGIGYWSKFKDNDAKSNRVKYYYVFAILQVLNMHFFGVKEKLIISKINR